MHINTEVQSLTVIGSAIAVDLNKNNRTGFKDCYKVEHKPGASLVQPVNGNPYVNVIDGDTVTRHTFKPANPASGTDAMRARILADKFYQEIAA